MGDLCRGAALECISATQTRDALRCISFDRDLRRYGSASALRGAKALGIIICFRRFPVSVFWLRSPVVCPPPFPVRDGPSRVAAPPHRLPAWSPSLCAVTRVRPARAPRRPRRARPPHGARTCPARPTGRNGPRVAGDRPLHCPSPPSRESGRIRELNSEAGAAPPVRIHHHLVTESKGGGDCV